MFPTDEFGNPAGLDCPHCASKNTWLARGVWTCHECSHSWDVVVECDHSDHIVAPDGTCPECGEEMYPDEPLRYRGLS